MLLDSSSCSFRQSDAPVPLDTVEMALAEVAAGRPVVVVDDDDEENRECEGDLIMAADAVTPEWMAFIVRHTSGLVCVPMTGAALARLGIPAMVDYGEDRVGTAFAVSVDARSGGTTGISARDRARTARVLADPGTEESDLTRPGHVLPLRARRGGVLARAGHTEAAVDLAQLAGREPVGILAQLVEDDGGMRRALSCRAFADEHKLVMISIGALREYRRRRENLVRRVVTARVPSHRGMFTAVAYADQHDLQAHLALVVGLDADGQFPDGKDVLVRVHSECLPGEVLGSSRCDCGPRLDAAIEQIASEGRGVVVYLRGHEGRGVGLLAKLQAYALQDGDFDAGDAKTDLGLPVDARDFRAAAEILADLGVESIQLLTDDPAEVAAMRHHGIDVSVRLPLVIGVNPETARYMGTKRDRMGNQLVGLIAGGRHADDDRWLSPSGAPAWGPVPTWSRPCEEAVSYEGT